MDRQMLKQLANWLDPYRVTSGSKFRLARIARGLVLPDVEHLLVSRSAFDRIKAGLQLVPEFKKSLRWRPVATSAEKA